MQKAALLAHSRYASRAATSIPPDAAADALQPGVLAMLLRPATSKLLPRNAGPFLVTRVQRPHVWLHSLTHALELKENIKNVRALRLLVPPDVRN